MSSELATRDYTHEQKELLRRTICKGSTDDEFQLFVSQCQRTGLDPLSRQCHAVKRWDSKERREVMTIQVGIDGFRLIADRTGKYAGNDEPVYDSEDGEHPNKATVTVWKLVDGTRQPFTRSARWSEFVQTTKDGAVTRFWARMPYLMLGKVAEALALRAAFPQELSGLYTTDEMGQAENDHSPVQVHRPAPQQAALPQGGQHDSAPAIDFDLVEKLETALRGAETRGEFDMAASLVKVHGKKDELTPAGIMHLRDVYAEMAPKWSAKKKPAAVVEPEPVLTAAVSEAQAADTF